MFNFRILTSTVPHFFFNSCGYIYVFGTNIEIHFIFEQNKNLFEEKEIEDKPAVPHHKLPNMWATMTY